MATNGLASCFFLQKVREITNCETTVLRTLSGQVHRIIVLSVILGVVPFDKTQECTTDLRQHVLGYVVILSGCVIIEALIVFISMRGSIIDATPRITMEYLLYIRLCILLVELVWLIIGVVWLSQHYGACTPQEAKRAILGIIICNWLVMFSVIISLWCTFDTAGRKWVVMKRFQESLKDRRHYKHSGSTRRNWRQRKAMRAYEESWDRRLQVLCCCVQRKGRNRNSIAEIAHIFTDFFRDLDVVPTDVVAGLVLLRRHQKLQRMGNSKVYQFLSGVPVTSCTKFLELSKPDVMDEYRMVVHYMKFALAAYGWPASVMASTGTGLCKLIPYLSCCCLSCCMKRPKHSTLIDDNCCHCNYAALRKLSGLECVDIVYVTYHVDIGEIPFYVAIDQKYKKIVICVRGTLSLQDVLTDLNADAETLPLEPEKGDWVGHKGMVQAAVYIKKRLEEERILESAFARTADAKEYDIVLVGHSLGAGTASILAILLKQKYTNIHCYSYSPPGGLLSDVCVEETKDYITSVVLAKDAVPRIGLPQMESLRTDLINVIKASNEAKWKLISRSLLCCCPEKYEPNTETSEEEIVRKHRDVTAHPSDSQIGLTAHRPLYPPGRIIHLVRKHQNKNNQLCKGEQPVYQALWADNFSFDEVLISPTMINDHMPDTVLEALEKVLGNIGPTKPTRLLPDSERKQLLTCDSTSTFSGGASPSPDIPNIIIAEELTPLTASNLHSENVSYDLKQSPAIGNVLLSDRPYSQSPSPTLTLTLDKSPSNTLTLQKQSSENNLSWDQVAVENILTLEKQPDSLVLDNDMEQEEELLSFEIVNETVVAPLASPETLSDGSLSRSGSSKECISKYITPQSVQPLESIKQSPVRKRSQTDSNITPERGSDSGVVRSEELLSIEGSGDNNDYSYLTSQPQNDNKVPLLENENAYTAYQRNRQNSAVSLDEIHIESVNTDNIHLDSQDENVNIGHSETDKILLLGKDYKKEKRKGELEDRNAYNGLKYERHSPTECNQFEYDHPNICYSQGSTGYPHGAYFPTAPVDETQLANAHTNDSCTSKQPMKHADSESQISQLAAKYVMKRSREQSDIAHLDSNTDVSVDADCVRKVKPVLHTVKSLPQTMTCLSEEEDIETPDSGLEDSGTNLLSDVEAESSV